ncbi:MAG: hypothetical protein ACYTF6_14355, partial [Planctomycetota bacterium]
MSNGQEEELTPEQRLANVRRIKEARRAGGGESAPSGDVSLIDEFRQARTDEERDNALERIRANAFPVPWERRREVKIKTTPRGMLTNLEHHYGKGNVIPLGGVNNNFAINDNGTLRLVEDVESFGAEAVKDIGDVVPEIAQGVGAALGTSAGALAGAGAGALGGTIALPGGGTAIGAGGGAVLGGATGAMAARAARQMASAAYPGEDYEPGAKGFAGAAGDVALEGLADVAGGAAMKWAGKALKGARGKIGWRARQAEMLKEPSLVSGKPGRQEVAEQAAAEVETGLPLSTAEVTLGEKALEEAKIFEAVRPTVVRQFQLKQSQRAARKLNQIYDDVATGKLTGEEATNQVTFGKRSLVANMWEDLERKAAVDFGAVQEAAGGRDIMQSQGAVNFI